MKALITVFSLVLFGSVAMANQSVFTYQRPFVIEQSHAGLLCPQMKTITAVNEPISGRGHSVQLMNMRGNVSVFAYESTTEKCRQDIICETINHYAEINNRSKVAMTLQNDGSYPTTNLPGYKMLKLSWLSDKTSTPKFCVYYML